MTEPVLFQIEGAVATVTINRPDQRNALDAAAKALLLERLQQAASADAIRAVVLTGAGAGFCAGQDLGEHAQALAADPATALDTVDKDYGPIVTLLATMPKPVVAAVNGTCVGAGLGLALACDLRYMAAGATLRTGFVNVGLAGDFGCTWLLNSVIGPSRTAELLFFATPLSAEDALREHLVHVVFPAGELMAAGRERAERLARLSAAALEGIKDNVARAQHSSLADAADAEVSWHVRLLATPEHRSAVEAMSRAIPASAPRPDRRGAPARRARTHTDITPIGDTQP
jgi:2-(1,2-epoxy-1,2-dihydrophenyl)acetyl-CoA isomerase